MRGQQFAGPGALAAAAEEADRALAGRRLDRRAGAQQRRLLRLARREIGMRPPDPAMVRRLVPRGDAGPRQVRRALHRAAAHEPGDLHAVPVESLEEAPTPALVP